MNKEQRSEAYDKIDRFLRNNLFDIDYAEFSDALECLFHPAGDETGRTSVEGGVNAPSADVLLDAARYRWLTAHAFVGECITENGTVLEIHNTDRRVPIGGSVDAAIDAAMKEQK